MSAEAGAVHIGTSGWNYKHWKERFYPDGLPQKGWLGYYAERFHTVEVNNSFYNLPSESTFRSWRDDSPAGFLFSVKASRYITHMKKLKDPERSLKRFMDRVGALEDALGPILFQLPPRWRFNRQRLEAFVHALPAGRRYTFELRDPSWHNDECLRVLSDAGAAFCVYDLKGELSPRETTADFVYVRLHGPGLKAYTGSYDREALSGWAGALSAWSRQGRDVFCYFDNDQNAYAAHNALELQRMLEG